MNNLTLDSKDISLICILIVCVLKQFGMFGYSSVLITLKVSILVLGYLFKSKYK